MTIISSQSEPVDRPSLAIDPEKVLFIIAKAREFDLEDEVLGDDGDDSRKELEVFDEANMDDLKRQGEDPILEELSSFINALTEDEQIDLVALTWLGRDDNTLADWSSLRAEAARSHNDRTAQYLLGTPLLSDFLEEGLSMLGYSVEEAGTGRF